MKRGDYKDFESEGLPMSLKKRILRNISMVTFAEVVSSILSYVIVVLIARLLGPSELGIYSFAFAFAGIFTFAYDFGISYFYLTQVSRDKANAQKYFGQYASLKLIFCLITMILPMVAIFFTHQEQRVVFLVFLAAISLFFQNYSYVARNTYYAYQRMTYEAIVRVVERAIAFLLGVFLLLQGYGLLAFLLILIFSNFISVVLSIYYLRKFHVPFSLTVDVPTWKTMLKTSWTSWLSTVFLIVYFQVDTIMLSFIQGYEATGIYNAAYKLISVVSKVPWIVILVLFPIMAEAHAKMSKDLLRGILEKGMQVMAFLGFPFVIGTMVIAPKIISFVYTTSFSSSVLVLQILVWTTLFLFLSNMAGWFFNSIGKPQVFAWATGISLAVNVLLNALLIPLFSYLGAAIATVITSIVSFFLLDLLIRKEGYALSLFRLLAKPLLASAAMGAVVFFLQSFLHILILIPLAIAVYIALLFVLGEIKKEDIRSFL